MNERKKLQLSDLCESIDYGFTASASTEPCGPKFLRITDIVPGYINWSSVPFTPTTLKEQEKYKLHDGDIVIARTGATTGSSSYISNPPDSVFASYLVRLKIKPTTSSRFIAYFLKSSIFKNHIKSVLGDKSAQPNASAKTMCSVKLSIPRFAEQKAIASVLGILDDKIENNRQMNEVLEKMALEIFKSWFIDFDPVHAKATGNTPAHMDTETAALFPSSFGDDGLPVGWQYKKLEDTSDLSWGDLKTTKKSYVETGFDAYSASGKDGKLPHFDFEKLGIVLSAIGANCGNTWLARGKWSCIKNTIRFWSKYDLTPTIFLYHATKGNNFWPIRGSAQPFISQGDARDQKIIVPANGEAISFEKIVGDFYEKISANEHENQILAKLRDTLLPKLMSGEIRVKDAERVVEATV